MGGSHFGGSDNVPRKINKLGNHWVQGIVCLDPKRRRGGEKPSNILTFVVNKKTTPEALVEVKKSSITKMNIKTRFILHTEQTCT